MRMPWLAVPDADADAEEEGEEALSKVAFLARSRGAIEAGEDCWKNILAKATQSDSHWLLGKAQFAQFQFRCPYDHSHRIHSSSAVKFYYTVRSQNSTRMRLEQTVDREHRQRIADGLTLRIRGNKRLKSRGHSGKFLPPQNTGISSVLYGY